MEDQCPLLALEIFPEEHSKAIAKSVIDTLIDSDFSQMLNSDNDIEFALDPLLYSFRLPEIEGTLSIFSRWLIDPSDSNAILNNERYNKYIRQIFASIPLIYELRKNHTQKALDDTYNFLKNAIIPCEKYSNKKDWKHPFQPETWSSSFRCIINSIRKTDPKTDSDIWDKLMILFVDGILISDLNITETDELIHSFFDICFTTNSNGQLLNYDKYWYKLFNEIFSQFLSFPADEKRRNFILILIKKMKSCSKQYEDKFLNQPAACATIKWPIRERLFTNSMKTLKDIQNQNAINNLFKQKLPADAVINLFCDCMFVLPFWDYRIIENINELFSFFTYAEFNGENKWQETFMKYLCFLMQKKTQNSLFKVVYGILNSSCNFVCVYPSLFYKILNILLSKSSILELPNYTNSNNVSITKLDLFPNPNLLMNGNWVSTMTSLLEFSRVEMNKSLEEKILLIIDKFCNCSELPFIKEDFNVYRLVLLANAGKDDLFARLIAQEAPTARSLRVERIWDFEMLSLAISPLFMPNFVDKIIEKQVIEHILSNFKNNEFSDRHIFWFLITLFELSKSTDLFIRNRTIISSLVTYLSDQKKLRKSNTQGQSNSPQTTNWFISKMIEIVYYSILIPSVPAAEVSSFSAKYKKITSYAINDRVLTFGENEKDRTFGVIVRGPFGISSFDITELMTPEKQPVPKSSLKENILQRDEIDLPSDSIFAPYDHNSNDSKTPHKKCVTKGFLMAMGFASIESNMSFHPLSPIDHTDQRVSKALSDFDALCNFVSLGVKVESITPNQFENASGCSFSTFLNDLGNSYRFGSCAINFSNKDESNDIVIVFNSSGLKISNKMINKQPDESKNDTLKLLNNHLVIEVNPVFNSFSKNLLLYKVKILRSNLKCLILPMPPNKPVVSSRRNLPRLLSMICFFYFSRLKSDEIVSRSNYSVPNDCPAIVSKYIEAFDQRKEKLDALLSLQKKEDTLNTIITD